MRRVWTLLVMLATLGVVLGGKRIPWWHIRIAQEQGPNACVVEEVPATGKEYWTECRYWLSRKICGEKTLIRYECCEGYQQVDGEVGCTGVKPLKNLLETAADLGATEFVRYIREAGLSDDLMRDGAMTLFVPTNDAFSTAPVDLLGRLDSYRGNPDSPILLYHMADSRFHSADFTADLLIPTRSNGDKLRVNKYSHGLATVNCAPIVRKDQQATNGIIHIVDAVLDPGVTRSGSVGDVVIRDTRFSELATTLEQSGFVSELRQPTGTFTLLAPSDEAFQKISKNRIQKILQDRDARRALLENHVLPHTLCIPAVVDKHKIRTIANKKLDFDCDQRGSRVDKKRMRGDFILADNGIVHIIDDLLLPNRAQNLYELARSEKLWTFLQLMKLADLEETFQEYGDYTLFVPSEAAWYSLPGDILTRARSDPAEATRILKYHVTQGRILTSEIRDNEVVMSLDEENPLRLLVFRKAFGVDNALIEKADMEGQNGVLHIIDNVLFPSNKSAGDMLRRDGNFTFFLRAMERAMRIEPAVLDLQRIGASFTFLVPTDDAFRALGQETMDAIMQNDAFLVKVIKNHIFDNVYTSASFKKGLYYNIQSKLEKHDFIKKHRKVKVDDATITYPDLLNTNGVIHVISKVLLPADSSVLDQYRTTRYGSSSSSSSSSTVLHRTHYTSSSSSSSRSSSSSSRNTATYSRRRGDVDYFAEEDDNDEEPTVH